MQQFIQLLISASQFLSIWSKYSIAVLPNICPVILPGYNLLLRVGRACRSLKMGVGEVRRLCFFTPAVGCFVKWLFFQYSFRTASISEFQKGLDTRIKTVFFKGCVWKEMLWAVGFSTAQMGLSKFIISVMKSLAPAGNASWGSVKDQDPLWVAPLLLHPAKNS